MADTSSVLAGAPGSSLREDTDAFNVRLREINREMQGILDKTSQHRHDVSRWYSTRDVAPVTAAATAVAAAPPPQLLAAQASSASAIEVTAELKDWIAAQIKTYIDSQLPRAIGPLVEQQVSGQVHRLSSRVESLHGTQEELKVAVDAISDEWKAKQASFAAAVSRVENTTKNALQHYQSDSENSTRKWLEELNEIRDSVGAMEGNYRLIEQRTSRRLDELARSHRDTVVSSTAEMERAVQSWKAELEGLVREQTASVRAERDSVESHVARLQGTLASVARAASAHATDIHTLMDGTVEQKSEMRSCRRDVNRLEMLLQSVACGLFQESEGAGGRDGRAAFLSGLSQNADNPAAGTLLVNELAKAKEQLSYLSGRLEGLERHVHQMDNALLAMSGSERYSSRYIAERQYPLQDSQNAPNPSNSNESLGSTHVPWPTAWTRRPSAATTPANAATAFSNGSPSSSQHQHQRLQAQQQQRYQQGQRPERSLYQAYPPGMNQSEPHTMNVMVGEEAGHSNVTTASSMGQPPQRSGFLTAAAAAHEAGDLSGGGAKEPQTFTAFPDAIPRHLQEAQRDTAPSQRRPLPIVIPVTEGEREEGTPAHQRTAHASPSDNLNSSPRSGPSSALQYSMLSGGRDENSYADQSRGGGGEEDSYVSRPESRNRMRSGNTSQQSSLQRLQREDSHQYEPAPTSDSESDRENQNLSRLPLD